MLSVKFYSEIRIKELVGRQVGELYKKIYIYIAFISRISFSLHPFIQLNFVHVRKDRIS